MPPVNELSLPPAFYAISALVFGLLVGSFLNVVIYRVPRGESIVYPGSHCGSCGAPVRPYDNIPLLSYALLGGRCRACRARISIIYPSVELLTGLLFFAVALKDGPSWVTVAEMWFVAVTIALIFIDARHWLLPNLITYPAFALALVAAAALAWFAGKDVSIPGLLDKGDQAFSRWQAAVVGSLILLSPPVVFWAIDLLDYLLFNKYYDQPDPEGAPEDVRSETALERQQAVAIKITVATSIMAAIIWVAALYFSNDRSAFAYRSVYTGLLHAGLGALVGGGVVWLLRALWFYLRGIQAMAMGDVKMMIVVGAFLGWQSALLVLFVGSLLGSVMGLVYARRSSQGLQTGLPFGVSLGIASLLALFAGTSVVEWYAARLH